MIEKSINSDYGFTLVEIMVVVVVVGVLAAVAFPNFSRWIADTRTRTVAESLQNGIRLAQAEAIKNGSRVNFFLTNQDPSLTAFPAANGVNWVISSTLATVPVLVQSGALINDSGRVAIVASNATITFNSIGRLVGVVRPATFQINNVDGSRSLMIQVTTSGGTRMCDPSKTLSATNPDGCGAYN